MKIALAFLIFMLWIIPSDHGWTDQALERPGELLDSAAFLPGDDEIPGWRRSEKVLRASNQEDLYKILNGGASLYLQHGFRAFVGQTYNRSNGTELEVYIFDQGTTQNTYELYENRYTKPSRVKEIAGLGEKARLDLTPLFCHAVDFIQSRFFVRVIIQEKTDDSLEVAISFARLIAKRIK